MLTKDLRMARRNEALQNYRFALSLPTYFRFRLSLNCRFQLHPLKNVAELLCSQFRFFARSFIRNLLVQKHKL